MWFLVNLGQGVLSVSWVWVFIIFDGWFFVGYCCVDVCCWVLRWLGVVFGEVFGVGEQQCYEVVGWFGVDDFLGCCEFVEVCFFVDEVVVFVEQQWDVVL